MTNLFAYVVVLNHKGVEQSAALQLHHLGDLVAIICRFFCYAVQGEARVDVVIYVEEGLVVLERRKLFILL